jgi:hypothetical protein
MEADGTITMDMFHPEARLTYPKTDPHYAEVLAHIGGLKPGEEKSVPPWSDGIDDARVNDAVAAYFAKKNGWKREELRMEIYGTNPSGSIHVGVGHGTDSASVDVDPKTYAVIESNGPPPPAPPQP